MENISKQAQLIAQELTLTSGPTCRYWAALPVK